jgi:hypothetical protein
MWLALCVGACSDACVDFIICGWRSAWGHFEVYSYRVCVHHVCVLLHAVSLRQVPDVCVVSGEIKGRYAGLSPCVGLYGVRAAICKHVIKA